MGLIGENYFPPMSDSHLSIQRHHALQQCFKTISLNKPSVIYICPTKGVNINLLPLLMINDYKFVLVYPSRKFFGLLNKDEKRILDAASAVADKIIVLSTKETSPLNWRREWVEGTRKVIDNSDWVMLAHNQFEDNESFIDLCLEFEGDPTPIVEVGFGLEE